MRRIRALVAVVAVCVALSGPASAQSPSPSSAASGDLAPAVVTGSFQCQLPSGGTDSLDTAPYWVRNYAFQCAATASDARVGGTLTAAFALDSWDSEFRTALYWWDVNLKGPDGAWTGRAYGLSNADFVIHAVAVLAGSGAYDGLVYATSWTEQQQTGLFQTTGLIQPGALPPGFTIPAAEPPPSPTPTTSPAPGASPEASASAAPSPGDAWTPVTVTSTCDFTNFPTVTCTDSANDPRVSGQATRTINLESSFPDGQDALMWNGVTLNGPDGTWTGTGFAVRDTTGVMHGIEMSSGSGTYAGLVYAIVETIDASGNSSSVGFIQSGALPTGFPTGARAGVTGTATCTATSDTSGQTIIACTEQASDPRVSGTSSRIVSGGGPAAQEALFWWDATLNGPEGPWIGRGYGVRDHDGILHGVEVLVGGGGYDGLIYANSQTVSADLSRTYAGVIQPGTPPPGTWNATIGKPADDGARITQVDQLDARTRDLTIESPALGSPPVAVKVRLLLPADFDAQPTATWPVLYLLHGANDDYTSWTRSTDVEALTAPDEVIVVMPAASLYNGAGAYADGWYSDWLNGGAGGPPAWETFHLSELMQLLERNFRAGDQHVVAGLSMGGYGALNYAARHPDLFSAAVSFSGVLDLKVKPDDFTDADSIARWGDPVANADNWDAHNPIKFVSALQGRPLYIAYGNGQPGPLDPAGTEPDALEQWIGQGSDLFVEAMNIAGVQATVNAYGPGTHSWPYWERELHASLPMLLQALGVTATPAESPAPSPGG